MSLQSDFQEESNLGFLDYQSAVEGIANSGNSKGKKIYLKWSESEKIEIGKYAAEYGDVSYYIYVIDQTPLKYVPTMNHTMTKKGCSSVPIIGESDKRSITGTFIVTLDGGFLPMQLIYGDKTKQSLPKFEFPSSFLLV